MKTILRLFAVLIILQSISFSQPSLIWSRHTISGSGPHFYNWQHRMISADANGNTYVIGQNDELPAGMYSLSYNPYGGTRFCDTALIGSSLISGQAIDSQYATYLFAGTIFEKYSSNGSLMWQTTLPYGEDWTRVIPTQQYAYVLNGISDPRTLYRFAGGNGTILNSVDVPYQSSYCFGILNGDYILGGKTSGSTNSPLLVTRLTASGVQVWSRSFMPPGGFANSPVGISVTSSGNIYLFVNAGSSGSGHDYIVSKLNSGGDVMWTSTYGNTGNVYINSWAVDNAENVYVASGTGTFKLNSSGAFQWADPIPQRVICLDGNNNVIVATNPSYDQLRTSKFSSAGIGLWSRDYQFPSSSANNIVNGIAADSYSNVYVAASYDNGSHYGLVLKYGDVYSVSGQIRFQDNNQPVNSGYVKALLYDSLSKQIVAIDSASIQPTTGAYTLAHIPRGISLDIMAFENDENELNFVPTYYPSTTSWQNATSLTVSSNLTGIDVFVYRINNTGGPYHIAGSINGIFQTMINLKGAIAYAKSGSNYQAFSLTDNSGHYRIDSLMPGTYTLIIDRMGFLPASRQVVVSNFSKDTIDFILNNYVIGITPQNQLLPKSFWLGTNYPNPFNPSTRISFGLPEFGHVKLAVYDLAGREVAILLNEEVKAGNFTLEWNASSYASGVYLLQMVSGDFSETRKLVLIK